MPTAILEALSTITSKGQTTVPSEVRRALDVGPQDRIRYAVHTGADGTFVTLTKASEATEEDPALAPFLDLLADDLHRHPERLLGASNDLVLHLRGLTVGVSYDIDQPLPADDD